MNLTGSLASPCRVEAEPACVELQEAHERTKKAIKNLLMTRGRFSSFPASHKITEATGGGGKAFPRFGTPAPKSREEEKSGTWELGSG